MHIHTSPDVSPRKCSDIGLAKRLQAAGMGGALVKSHGNDTAPRAALLNEQFPELFFAGGIVLNRQAGGLNPFAVRACGKMGGRFVWFPTMDSLSYQQFHHKDKNDQLPEGLICLLDDNGEVKKEVLEVLEAAAEYDMIAATGHVSAEEGFAAACAARKMGLTAVLTHADLVSIEEIAAQIRTAGCDHVFLSTDFGQPKSPYSDEGIAMYAAQLEGQGFTPEELTLMFRTLPERLLKKAE